MEVQGRFDKDNLGPIVSLKAGSKAAFQGKFDYVSPSPDGDVITVYLKECQVIP
jgi:hypothetical protein